MCGVWCVVCGVCGVLLCCDEMKERRSINSKTEQQQPLLDGALSGTWSIRTRTLLHSLHLRARIFDVLRARWRAFFAVEARLPFSQLLFTILFLRALLIHCQSCRWAVPRFSLRNCTLTGTQRGERKDENKL